MTRSKEGGRAARRAAGCSSRGRRRVLGFLGLAGLAPLALAGARVSPVAADEPPKRVPKPAAPPATGPGGPAPTPEGPSRDARDLAAMARRRYGKHLDRAQLEALTEEIDDNLKAGERLRKVKLANSDEPDVVFHAEP